MAALISILLTNAAICGVKHDILGVWLRMKIGDAVQELQKQGAQCQQLPEYISCDFDQDNNVSLFADKGSNLIKTITHLFPATEGPETIAMLSKEYGLKSVGQGVYILPSKETMAIDVAGEDPNHALVTLSNGQMHKNLRSKDMPH